MKLRLAWMLPLAIAVLLPAPALAWHARKAAPKPAQHRHGHAKTSKLQGPLTELPLQAQVDALLAGAGRLPAASALKLLKSCVTAREMGLAVRLAEAVAQAPSSSVAQLVDAATALGQGADTAVQRRLWQLAYDRGKNHPALGRTIAEGQADALIAASDKAGARKVLQAALARATVGTRRALLERWVTLGREDGGTAATAEALAAWRDPDAAALRAQLLEESGDEPGALATLRAAWQAFAGNRGLQTAYIGACKRMGLREELRTVVAQVVHLAPADPMPWLTVLDADIAARDAVAARKLSDELARRHPRHSALIESLIDREQRLGGDARRLGELYEALLRAAPSEAQPIEAYAEWLLGRGEQDKAMEVLARLRKLPAGEQEGMLRQATLLLEQNRPGPARSIAQGLAAAHPGDAGAERLLALIDEREGKASEAGKRWLALASLPDHPEVKARTLAAQARQALVALYRRMGLIRPRLQSLGNEALAPQVTLGTALLFLDVAGQAEDATARGTNADWTRATTALLARFPSDPEVLASIAAGLEQRAAWAPEGLLGWLSVLQALARVDADAAEPSALRLCERALAQANPTLAREAEALLLGQGGNRGTPTVLLRLGDLHLRYGDNAQAAVLFRRAAAGGPQDTRATARLATLFRMAGAQDDEDQALRDIVLRASDAEELDAAGQRLLTVALARGHLEDLVRWLDAVAPHHPHREMLERFRMAAYDTWLRGAALDRALGQTAAAPGPGPVGDALASGDLAMQVRALRQLSLLHRSLPLAVARQLLHSQNPVLRRDTALALGSSGSEVASQLLIEVLGEGLDNDDEVQRAELIALGQLPAVAGEEPLLVSLLGRPEGALAAMCLGRIGAETAIPELAKASRSGRRETQLGALMALGALIGRLHAEPRVAAMWPLVQESGPMMAGADPARRAVQLWALAASDVAEARTELRRQALQTPSTTLRNLAIMLLGAKSPPLLPELSALPGDAEATRELRARVVRLGLAPWMGAERGQLREALARLDDELARADEGMRGTEPAPTAPGWCASWRDLLAPGSRLGARCPDHR